MKIEFVDSAGQRITDGSSIALATLALVPTVISLLPEAGPLSTKDAVLMGVAVLGCIFKFIKITI